MKSHWVSKRIADESPEVGLLNPKDGWSIFAAILRSVVPLVANSNASRISISSRMENEIFLDDFGIAFV